MNNYTGPHGDCQFFPRRTARHTSCPNLSLANCCFALNFIDFCQVVYDAVMREIVILFVHLIATLFRLLGPGGLRSVVAESVLVKHQLLIDNRSRQRSPNLRISDRLIAGLCALLMRPSRRIRSAIVLKPSTLLHFHETLKNATGMPS
jgi:hypothetical protein